MKDLNPENEHLEGEKNSKLRKIMVGFMVIAAIAMVFSIYKINEIRTRAYGVSLGDATICISRDKESIEEILKEVETELQDKYNAEIVISKELIFEDIHAKDKEVSSKEYIIRQIHKNIDYRVKGYTLYIDDEAIASARTESEIWKIIEDIKKPYLEEKDENDNIIEVDFLENIEIKEEELEVYKLLDEEELKNRILVSDQEIKTHTVEVGESFWTIAKLYDMTVDELIEANPDQDPDRINIDDELMLIIPKTLITVKTIEEVESEEKINYEQKIEYDKNMYKTQKKVKVKGEFGKKHVVSRLIKHNGRLVEKEIVNEEINKKPTTEIIVQGTKEVPKTVATGAFLMPTRGRISSRYGMRWGRMHKGLDIAAPTGTPIKAADGGTVTFSGWKGGYGYMVEVNHGNGYVTRYAHASRLAVKRGNKVYKGQVIAYVGNTGNSTGSHLHFEVLKNGRNVNPQSYVK